MHYEIYTVCQYKVIDIHKLFVYDAIHLLTAWLPNML